MSVRINSQQCPNYLAYFDWSSMVNLLVGVGGRKLYSRFDVVYFVHLKGHYT
jgi:hypothetical protein